MRAGVAKAHATRNTPAFLPDPQPSRTARIERKLITGRFIKTAVATPGVYARNSKDAGMWGMKTFARMATIYPNSRCAQTLSLPFRSLRYVTTKAATVSTAAAYPNAPAQGGTGTALSCWTHHGGSARAS